MKIALLSEDKDIIKIANSILISKSIVLNTCGISFNLQEKCLLGELDLIILEQKSNSNYNADIINKIRNKNIQTPILVVSKENDTDNKIASLRNGADDYLVLPFNDKEFLARIKAIIRRSNGYSHNVLKNGELTIDISRQQAFFGETQIELTKKEYMILEFLFMKKGITLNKDRFLNHLYYDNNEPEAKIIDVFICKLRKKLEIVSGGQEFIKTDWGRGYYLTDNSDL